MLSVPLVIAALSAGLLGGAHCIGMCGGISNLLVSAGSAGSANRKVIPIKLQQSDVPDSVWHMSALLHAGRICTYGVLGGIVGALGAAGLLFKPYLPVQMTMFMVGNLALIWLGLRLVGYAPGLMLLDRLGQKITFHVKLPVRFSLAAQTGRHPFLTGMAWGCMPCGLVYAVLPFSLLSGGAFSGAALMLIFGLGALPYLLFAQGIGQWLNRRILPIILRGSGAVVLIGIGLFGLWHYDMTGMPALFCVTPVH
ncbi:MAG: sulfite exporter TauE/SafE family protein [Glaciimonas sp.]|nr:sulfite exporter TauE/SafE family protein [Glaciimonas sp.]